MVERICEKSYVFVRDPRNN